MTLLRYWVFVLVNVIHTNINIYHILSYHKFAIVIVQAMYLCVDETLWPEGNFAILETVYGCPDSGNQEWLSAYIDVMSTNQSLPGSTWSPRLHMSGPYDEHSLSINLCVKGRLFGRRRDTPWPAGEYCIINSGDGCLTGI